ncbi:MAG TPA: prepilin-type N-terminal cleavage/methylation domain-containing protein [Geomonas sp.]|nr:prepilin-type N-terminal cleavage/methylation domain-containing protein [Geomonas sp.]
MCCSDKSGRRGASTCPRGYWRLRVGERWPATRRKSGKLDLRKEAGFTLVELMVSILILSVGLLGLFKSVYSTLNFNLQNQLRAEAVSYGDELMARELDQPFASISTSQTQNWGRASSQGRSLNNGVTFWNFSAVRTHVYVSPSSTNVQVRVSWRYKGSQYSHNLGSVASK